MVNTPSQQDQNPTVPAGTSNWVPSMATIQCVIQATAQWRHPNHLLQGIAQTTYCKALPKALPGPLSFKELPTSSTCTPVLNASAWCHLCVCAYAYLCLASIASYTGVAFSCLRAPPRPSSLAISNAKGVA
ncbi:unnamed protein product [Ilex paraguariensis]|uniref:Uncharacterized protein n=1 Tax=Ilex paraguariensis TaxID=185542 RepID=A0ABC8UW94_9AQUA